MKKLLTSNNIFIKQSSIPNAGRGVYAKSDIKKGDTIEICPVIEIPSHDMNTLRENVLVTYIFFSGKNKKRLFIALGFGSIYNHLYNPNASYKINPTDKTITFVAIKNIKKSSEITVNYNSMNPINKYPLWFE